MDFSQDVLSYSERAVMRLRSLYRQFGYTPYKMSRFEEYGLYAKNKAFLASGDIITFTGIGGKLMALRPDVTLSIVKNAKDDGLLKKLYYNENVYKPDGYEFKEQMQIGLECIGDIDVSLMSEVLMLARRSLSELGGNSRLELSHMGFLSGLLQNANLTPVQMELLLRRISEKNASEVSSLCAEYGLGEEFSKKLLTLVSVYGSCNEVLDELREISVNEDTETALRELEDVFDILRRLGVDEGVNLDFSIVNDLNYYSGIIFHGYIEGIPKKVLSGGRYDELLSSLGKKAGAIGFAVYLDLLELQDQYPLDSGETNKSGRAWKPSPTNDIPSHPPSTTPNAPHPTPSHPPSTTPNAPLSTPSHTILNIALPKGRLGEKAYSILEEAGYGCPEIREESRKLVFESEENGVRYFWVKPSDVAIYVERGIADIGIVGKDTLLDFSPEVYELLDLGIGKCRMCIAAKKNFTDSGSRTLRVATKFANIAGDYYEKQGREIDIIKLNGSIEIAPLLGLSDVIVDLVETGKTLEENNLEITETIADISARLVANKASYRFKYDAISGLCARLKKD